VIYYSLPDSLRAFLDKEIATKGFGNVSEYFRTLLRRAQQQDADERLETLLLAGLTQGGESNKIDRKFWKELRVEARRLVTEHTTAKEGRRHGRRDPPARM
jgi:antitoxin ParD1/3/4